MGQPQGRDGPNLFAGGFLGLDDISLFDRSKQLPSGAVLEQADGTAWMAFYCVTMLAMAMELAKEDPGSMRTWLPSSSSILWPSSTR